MQQDFTPTKANQEKTKDFTPTNANQEKTKDLSLLNKRQEIKDYSTYLGEDTSL